MMRTKENTNMLSLIYKPVCIILLLFGLFGLVRLRSSVISVEYNLRNLEEQKIEALKNMKMLFAERAKIMSLSKVDSPFQNRTQGENKYVNTDYVFPDRIKVVHMKRSKGPETYKASLKLKND